jgi:hypothetical protein
MAIVKRMRDKNIPMINPSIIYVPLAIERLITQNLINNS